MVEYDNIIVWFQGIVGSQTISATNVAGIFYCVFGCVLMCMVVGFIFKFILKLFDR